MCQISLKLLRIKIQTKKENFPRVCLDDMLPRKQVFKQHARKRICSGNQGFIITWRGRSAQEAECFLLLRLNDRGR